MYIKPIRLLILLNAVSRFDCLFLIIFSSNNFYLFIISVSNELIIWGLLNKYKNKYKRELDLNLFYNKIRTEVARPISLGPNHKADSLAGTPSVNA